MAVPDQDDLASLLEQVSSPSAPCNQDWFNNATPTTGFNNDSFIDTPTGPDTPMNDDWPS